MKLTIETSQGEDTAFRSAVVVQEPHGPVASITADRREGVTPLDVQFTDMSEPGTAAITSWLWDFDDPGSGEANASTEQHPMHTFTKPGLFSITLTVSTEHGTDQKTELAFITGIEGPRCGANGKLEFAAAGMSFLVFERITRRRRSRRKP